MKSPKSMGGTTSWTLLIMLALMTSCQNKSTKATQDSCQHFTQKFYDWYVASEDANRDESALALALKNRRSAFVPDLAQQLEDVEAEQKRLHEPILDFDPVLNTQDSAPRYAVEKISLKDDHCWATIYGIQSEMAKREKPNVVAELILRDGRWLFSDFHYPDSEGPNNESLLRILRSLRTSK